MTWNVLHALDLRTGRIDLDVVAEHLAALAPDVVGVQEVDRGLARSDGAHQIDELAERLGWQGVFAPSLVGSPEVRWKAAGERDEGGPGYGIGLLSPHPISEVRRVTLPGGGDGHRDRTPSPGRPGWDREPRIGLVGSVALGDRQVAVANTHLSYLPWRASAQLATLLRRYRPAAPAVLLGDFNLPPWITRRVAGGWRHAGGEPTHPATQPRLQLDQVLLRGATAVAARTGPPAGSDHRPLVVDAVLD